jgi:hypothetical protein
MWQMSLEGGGVRHLFSEVCIYVLIKCYNKNLECVFICVELLQNYKTDSIPTIIWDYREIISPKLPIPSFPSGNSEDESVRLLLTCFMNAVFFNLYLGIALAMHNFGSKDTSCNLQMWFQVAGFIRKGFW